MFAMKRRLCNALAGVSLVLCVATMALWARSYWTHDTVGRVGQAKLVCLSSAADSLYLTLTPANPANESPGPRPFYFHNMENCGGYVGVVLGGHVIRFGGRIRTNSGTGFVVAPHWLAALLLSALPLLWMRG